MAKRWVPGAWDPQLFLQGKLLGRGRGRVPLGAGRRARLASFSLEGTTLTPLRRHGPPPHPPAGAPPPAEASATLSPRSFSPQRSDSSNPVPLPWKSRAVLAQSWRFHWIPLVLLSNVHVSFSPCCHFLKNSRPVNHSVACFCCCTFLHWPFSDA